MKLIRLLAPVCALLIPTVLAAETFEGKVSMKVTSSDSKDGNQTVAYSIKEGFMRVDANSSKGGGSFVMDLKNRQMILLIPQRQMYMVRDLPEANPGNPGQGQAGGGQANANQPTLTDTGEKDTILGYSCEKYTVTGAKETSEIWVTDQLGFFGGLSMGGGPGRQQPPKAWESALKGKGFFPLRVVTLQGGKERFRMEVTSIDKSSLPDSLFQAPEGWTKFDPAAMMGGLGIPGTH